MFCKITCNFWDEIIITSLPQFHVLGGGYHVWFHFGNPQWSEVNSLWSPYKLLMLFTRSRRREISRRSDFTPGKKTAVKSHAGVKICVSQNIWTLTKVKRKIAIWSMFYEKKTYRKLWLYRWVLDFIDKYKNKFITNKMNMAVINE